MAGLGGAIIVPSQSAVLGMGVDALVLAFIVVVIGGLGSLEGALVGALIVDLGGRLAPGAYRVLLALALNGNLVNPEVKVIPYRVAE